MNNIGDNMGNIKRVGYGSGPFGSYEFGGWPISLIGGSVSFTSSPPDARIWIDDVDTGINTPAIIVGLAAGNHTYKLVSGIYTASGTFTITEGMTTDISVIIDVTAIDMTLSTYTCIDSCQVIVTTTWKNNGNTDVTFRPAITVNAALIQTDTDITIIAGGTSTPVEIVTPTLSVGRYEICPLPN